MIIHISGIRGGDTGTVDLNTVTGVVTVVPGNRYDDVRRGLEIIKQAVEIQEPKFRQEAIRAASEYFNEISEILGPSGNVIAIF
jgi:hypothetical protein